MADKITIADAQKAQIADAPKSQTPKTDKKVIAVALQGGGSHGAYTWGVLDALLEEERISIEGLSGTSAGGLNATATAQGIVSGGNKGARETLSKLWHLVGEQGKKSALKPFPWDKAVKNFSVSGTPGYKALQFFTGLLSPYQFNPKNTHPLQPVIDELFDFEKLRQTDKVGLFLCATHIATGKLKIFKDKELSREAVLASACVPTLFQAMEVDGEFYWDGGFIGNPAIYPLIYNLNTPDIMVIQIRRIHDPKVPITVHDIHNRLGEITQNSCLTREMRSIAFITKLIEDGIIPADKIKKLNMHLIRDDAFFGSIDRASGFCADPDFLDYLFKAGRRAGKTWLQENLENIGKKSTARIDADFI
jgi:NTE family protein